MKYADNKNNQFNSISKMAKAHGINTKTYRSRIKRLWSLEYALMNKNTA